jgi:hypothetical protein
MPRGGCLGHVEPKTERGTLSARYAVLWRTASLNGECLKEEQ